jgi:hypothetical protein
MRRAISRRGVLLLDAPLLLLVPAAPFEGAVAGCGLLAIAPWRGRAVRRWAALAVGAFPLVGLVLFPAGAALAVAGFGACALTLRHGAVEPSHSVAAAAAPVASNRLLDRAVENTAAH